MLQTLDNQCRLEDILNVLMKDGGVIIANQVENDLIEKIKEELRPHFDQQGHKFQNDFNGYTTLRLGAILGLSQTSSELIAHSRVMEVADAVLRPHCECYRIGSSTAIEIHPGESKQTLHFDDDFYPIRIPNIEYQMAALWALDDFTLENGATRVIPGSHKFKRELRLDEDSVVQAVMPKGSVLFYLGSTIHGGGANTSELARSALITTYSLGWLRQEENQYLSIPREVADSYPEPIRRLMGYQSHGKYLGVYPDDPDKNWFDA